MVIYHGGESKITLNKQKISNHAPPETNIAPEKFWETTFWEGLFSGANPSRHLFDILPSHPIRSRYHRYIDPPRSNDKIRLRLPDNRLRDWENWKQPKGRKKHRQMLLYGIYAFEMLCISLYACNIDQFSLFVS